MERATVHRAYGVTLVALLHIATACSDHEPNGPGSGPLPATERLLTCRAELRAQTLTCSAPTTQNPGSSKLSADLVLGGQGTYVALRSSNVSYDGTSTFQADVTVENLTAQPLGTPDGIAISGVKVFFYSGPTVTGGTGTVTVANADATGMFTGTSQPYFFYDQIVPTAQVSSAKP